MNLDDLIEISQHFEVTYQSFKDTNTPYFTIKLLGNPAFKAQGSTLEEAYHNLSEAQERESFRQKLQHAGLGNKTLEEWKQKLREIL